MLKVLKVHKVLREGLLELKGLKVHKEPREIQELKVEFKVLRGQQARQGLKDQ